MKAFHVIGGLPRAGSTLLCNILAQNPAFDVLHTSPLPGLLDFYAQGVTDSNEIKGMFASDPDGTDERTLEAARAMVRGFSSHKKIAFDKNRLWNVHQFALEILFPGAKIIACVRDLRAIFGSVEKRWRRNPLMQIPPGRTIRARMNNQFDPAGVIGASLHGIEDLILAENPMVCWVWCHELVSQPRVQMQRIYAHLGEPEFEHQFENVVSTAVDLDALYLGKFPHNGSGKVAPQEDWQQYVPQALGQEIAATNAAYQQKFGYV